MTQSKLRLFVFCSWIGSLLLHVVALLLGPVLRAPGTLVHQQVIAVLPTIIGLHFPALSIFAAFWFPDELAEVFRLELSVGLPIILFLTAARFLLMLSRCGRCSKPLFHERASPVEVLRFSSPASRDYRAKALLGSFELGSWLEMARSGGVNCMWCGHRVGEASRAGESAK